MNTNSDIEKHGSVEETEKLIAKNKQMIKLLTELNAELSIRRNYQQKYKQLQKEADELYKEYQQIGYNVDHAWNEKIMAEQRRTEQLESELKKLEEELASNADTPGYQQAIKHTDIQDGASKGDAPSTRTNYKNMASRLQTEIKKLQHQVNERKLTLIDEIKKKTDLEEEVRELRSNISQNKRSVTPSRITTSVPDLVFH